MNDCDINKLCQTKILIIEPFYGGSHKELIDTLITSLQSYTLITLPAKKWHWRARCGALSLFHLIPEITDEAVLFCSSVLNLAELLGIRPELNKLKKIVYFHENQLIYPVKEIKHRDIQYSYNQITTCLAADILIFNSNFNKDSFLDNIKNIIKIIPDYRPTNLKQIIENKSRVIYFPVKFPLNIRCKYPDLLHIVWPHRWEFDKDPCSFFKVLYQLKDEGYNFLVSVLGENFQENPPVFDDAKKILKNEIVNFGYVANKQAYYNILGSCHVSVSTAKHEFFGVAMLETVHCGCFPLVPKKLVYPEIYPPKCQYTTQENLLNQLRYFCEFPAKALEERKQLDINLNLFSSQKLLPQFTDLFDNFPNV